MSRLTRDTILAGLQVTRLTQQGPLPTAADLAPAADRVLLTVQLLGDADL